MEKSNSPPPHLAGRSLTLRVGFYLPERLRGCGTTGPKDHETTRQPHSKATPPLPSCGSSRAYPPPKHLAPSTLRVSLHVPTPKTPLPSRCGSSSAHCPKKTHSPLPSCGSSPTLRVLRIVPSQVNRRSDALKNSQKADLITIIIIVNSPILRIFRRLLLFSNE